MDAFWLIPTAIAGMAFLTVLYVWIGNRPSSHAPPQVLLDKPPDGPEIDPAEHERDWTGRPCGSYMEWLFGPRK
jgi:hypothetical protein